MHRVLSIVLLTLRLETRIIDYSSISFTLQLGFYIPSITFSRQIYLKSRVDWSRICQDLQESTRGGVYNSPDSVNAFNDLLISIISRIVPTKIIRRRLTDEAWFDDNCINAFNDKQNAYRLCECNRT